MAQGAIYHQLKSATTAEIDLQIKHLIKSLEAYPENKERFQAMHDGARTVLNILERDPITASSTTSWLEQLSYEQLTFAKQEAIRLLTKKDEEQLVRIWSVHSLFSPTYFFKTYEEAKIKLIELMNEDLTEKERRNEFSIKPTKVRESELSEYI